MAKTLTKVEREQPLRYFAGALMKVSLGFTLLGYAVSAVYAVDFLTKEDFLLVVLPIGAIVITLLIVALVAEEKAFERGEFN